MIDFVIHANNLIKQNLIGLPGFSKLVIYEALPYLDYSQGKISLPTLYEFAVNDFHVERAPGRKREVVNENTIRNALRTIKKFKGDFFKIRSVNQRIEIEMPEVRKLYASLTGSNKDAGVTKSHKNTPKTLINTEESNSVEGVELSEKTPEVAAANSPIKEYIYNKHNSNKQTVGEGKLLIADDFYPSDETVKTALDRGLLKVTDSDEIAAFIAYNQEQESRWEDFNPIFLLWLERCFSHKPKQKKQITRTTKDANNEYRLPTTKTNPIAESIRLNQAILGQHQADEQQLQDNLCSAYSNALDGAHQSVQEPFRLNFRP